MRRTMTIVLCCTFVALGGAEGAADSSVLEVSRKDCKRLLRHEPRGDVEYKTHMAGEMTRRAIRVARQRAGGN